MTKIVALMMRLLGRRTCQEVADILHNYFEGSLDPTLTAIIERHLQDCPDCQAFVHTYGETIKLTGEFSVDEVPNDLCDRVHRALDEFAKTRR